MLALLLAVLVGSIYIIRKLGQDKTAGPEPACGYGVHCIGVRSPLPYS